MIVSEFLELVTKPVLSALSPAYQQGSWLDDVIEKSLQAFDREIAVDGDAVEALKRLSEIDAVRILTIHKCKGLEFAKVVVLGVEKQLFWGDAALEEFFVAISRAKDELVLAHVDFRARPSTPVNYWRKDRTAKEDFLEYTEED